jgi:hypothetical protein
MKTGKITRRLKVLEKLRALIAKLNNRAIAEMKSYRDPGSDIEAVMRGLFILMGDPLSRYIYKKRKRRACIAYIWKALVVEIL